MAIEVRLPQLGQTMEEGTLVDYKVRVDDEVKKGDVIFEVETDKATLEVESPADGFVKHILADLGQTLLVGEPVLILADKNEKVPQSFIDSLKHTAAPAPAPPAQAPPAPEIKLAETIPLSKLQNITAQKMLQSIREIPSFYLNVKADVTELVKLRTELNKTSDVKISYNDFIIRSVATGLEKFPIMTGRLAGDIIKLADSINIGLAIAVPHGLVAPIVRDANKKDLVQIARDSKALIEKARTNKLAPSDLQGGCITISNLGAFGIETNIAIVVPGQCSILGVGKITDTCMPDDGKSPHSARPDITVRKLMNLTLSADHRVVNGAYAAQFLDFARRLLQDTSNFA